MADDRSTTESQPSADQLVKRARELLLAVRHGAPTDEHRRRLADTTTAELNALDERPDAATAVWLNVYNAVVQDALADDPDRLSDKRAFFGRNRITVAGTELSLDDIEHGLLRSSQWKYGLGYVRWPFPSEFERQHRLPEPEPRIHFALNCGAASCPPIAAYTPERIDDELDLAVESYLDSAVVREDGGATVRIPRQFLWYRGDFGGRRGIRLFLRRYGVIGEAESPRVRYLSYDWSPSLGRFVDRDT